MRVVFYYLQGSREEWADTAAKSLTKKINFIVPFELIALKSKSRSRENASEKLTQEEKRLFEAIEKDDWVILFDEAGRLCKSSVEFSKTLVRALESGKRRVVFIIGGPYGFSDKIKERADLSLSLSPMTMNHFVAKVTALEQVYRGLTIWKGIRYHND